MEMKTTERRKCNMKNLPEKIYISCDAHYDPNDWSIGYHKKQNSCQVEYIRSDIAKEFASFYLHETFEP